MYIYVWKNIVIINDFFKDKMWLFYVVFIVEKWNEVKYFRN